ncbi:MAG TPA: RRXRR domain-containing protein [Sporosarcina psychrophila]|uniref:RRXRR domain-containing protein n=1 Tax=Sporosarcina psychrophila TaxID=1476 RepID=A0A921G143_SPOPS|nr:RRXRR domain-containing protein [Sporosarcina psychrophila]
MPVCAGSKQPILLGAEAGAKLFRRSVTMESRALFEDEVKLCTDIRELFATRPSWRSAKRSQKVRYRNPRPLTIKDK